MLAHQFEDSHQGALQRTHHCLHLIRRKASVLRSDMDSLTRSPASLQWFLPVVLDCEVGEPRWKEYEVRVLLPYVVQRFIKPLVNQIWTYISSWNRWMNRKFYATRTQLLSTYRCSLVWSITVMPEPFNAHPPMYYHLRF
jgi:hypothetical protein